MKNYTSHEVGPGKYSANLQTLDRTIHNPTIPRAANVVQQVTGHYSSLGKKKGATFQDEESSDEEHLLPGPGEYLHGMQTTQFGKNPILHDYPQKFGTTVNRFRDKSIGGPLGPGQYEATKNKGSP